MIRKMSMIVILVILALMFVSCGTQPAPITGTDEGSHPQADQPAEAVQVFTTWYQYDENNEDPASDERVGNEYLRTTIPQFNEAFAGQWEWINQPKAFDKMTAELVAAVQAGGDVPDIYELSNTQDIIPFYQNGTVQDLTIWAQEQSWWNGLDPNAIEACKGPDNALYCIPIAQRPQLVYVWNDRFPGGYPNTPGEFLTRAEELKEVGLYAITFFASTDFAGEGVTRAMWTIISSFGGTFDDDQGNMLLNTPENIAAIEFLREIVVSGYVPEIAFAGGFQEEEAFKDASAGYFPTGFFGYRYINPLTAPDGTQYAKGDAQDMIDAIEAGDVYLAPSFSVEGVDPGCGIDVAGLSIPTGAPNPDGAKAYINWIMSPGQNAAWVIGPGGGFPVLEAAKSNELFQSEFYKQGSEALANSSCSPWYGSLQRPNEAQEMIMQSVYKLIKEDPTADIIEELKATQEEYNAAN